MLTELKESTQKCLKGIKKRYGLTQSELAKALGINRTTLYLYESGKRLIPTELVMKIWEVYKIEPNDVLGIVKD